MTSGNLAGEPIVIDDRAGDEPASRGFPADAWLTHDRPIQVPCDDSVLRVAQGRVLPGAALARPCTAAHRSAVLRPTGTCCRRRSQEHLLHRRGPARVDVRPRRRHGRSRDPGCLRASHRRSGRADRGHTGAVRRGPPHPAYRSAAWAERNAGDRGGGMSSTWCSTTTPTLASAGAENGYDGAEPVIGFAFDGTGFGDDGAAWGGELMIADYQRYDRTGHLRYTALPGGDAGVRNPCRMALSHLRSAGVAWDPRLPCVATCDDQELAVVARQLETGVNTVPTSSMGLWLFDAMSALAGVCQRVAYEAEACHAASRRTAADAIDTVRRRLPLRVGRRCSDLDVDRPDPGDRGRRRRHPCRRTRRSGRWALPPRGARWCSSFWHAAQRSRTGLGTVALSGGVFLALLTTALRASRFRPMRFQVLSHHRVPPRATRGSPSVRLPSRPCARRGSRSRRPERTVPTAQRSLGALARRRSTRPA